MFMGSTEKSVFPVFIGIQIDPTSTTFTNPSTLQSSENMVSGEQILTILWIRSIVYLQFS